MAQDRYAALLMGIDPERSDGVAFAVSAGIGAAAGILVAPIFFVSFNMGASVGLKGFVAAVIGGLGTIPGAIMGASSWAWRNPWREAHKLRLQGRHHFHPADPGAVAEALWPVPAEDQAESLRGRHDQKRRF